MINVISSKYCFIDDEHFDYIKLSIKLHINVATYNVVLTKCVFLRLLSAAGFFANTQNWKYWHQRLYYVKQKYQQQNVTSNED